MDILQYQFGHRLFRQSDDQARAARAGSREIGYANPAKDGGLAGQRLGVIFFGDLRVIGTDVDGESHVFHGDVAVTDVFHHSASAAGGLDAETAHRVLKGAVLDRETADTAGRLAADGHPVAMQEGAVADSDILARRSAARNRVAGLKGHVVVADIQHAFDDANSAAGAWVSRIRTSSHSVGTR